MEKPRVRISVRNLVEFILRSGDLDNSSGTSGDKEAMLKGVLKDIDTEMLELKVVE